jgi:SAM-dependent methyltransferase
VPGRRGGSARQYGTTDRLGARAALHARYARVDWFAWVADRMALPAGAHVLDIGCGPAWFWRAALPRLPGGLHLTLVDASPAMVEAARERDGIAGRVATLRHVVAELRSLPFADECFEAVVAMHVLHHVDDPRAGLAELRRVLKPGGLALVSANAVGTMAELRAMIASVFGGPAVDPGAARFSLDDAERLMAGPFTDLRRHDLQDGLTVTEPKDALAYLLSMPPAADAPEAMRDRLALTVADAASRTGGIVEVTKHAGLVVGRRPQSARRRR